MPTPAASLPDSTPSVPVSAKPARPRWARAWGTAAILFGLATLKEGSEVLLSEEARREIGSVVPFVLWFNVTASFAYVTAGVGTWAGRRWARTLAVALAATTLLVFAAFGVHVALGRPFAMRTVAALTLRSAFWMGAAAFATRRGGADGAAG